MVIEAAPFKASPPAGQHNETVRQFQAIERELAQVRRELADLRELVAAAVAEPGS